MKRIAVGQLLQESNSLSPIRTTLADFEAFGLAEGAEVMARFGETGELAGFAKLPDIAGERIEWVGLLRALAWPSGPMEDALLEDLLERLLRPLQQTQADGVLLSLHGGHCAETEPDVTGRALAAVRSTVGSLVPIVATLDLHANITRRMVVSADALVGYHTFPHVDQPECGARAARALARLIQTDERPRLSVWKIPMVTNDEGRSTDRGILAGLWQEIAAAESSPGVLATGLFVCQPWLDVPELGWAVYEAALADEPALNAADVARRCWETRSHAEKEFLRPDEIIPTALTVSGRPVVVSESYDATNSGAPGDSTHLLAEFANQKIPEGGALTFCVDPEAVGRCFDADPGSEVSLRVGGKRDTRYCKPIMLEGRIVRLGEIRYRLHGHAGHNLRVDMGRAGVVVAGGATVVLTERTGPGSSPSLYEAVGLDPRKFKIVVAKSPEGFRRDYESFAAKILYCAAPGCSTPDLTQVGYRHVSRPLYPVDDIEDMGEARWAGGWT